MAKLSCGRTNYDYVLRLCSLTRNDVFVSVLGFVFWLLAVFPSEISRHSDGLCFEGKRKQKRNDIS